MRLWTSSIFLYHHRLGLVFRIPDDIIENRAREQESVCLGLPEARAPLNIDCFLSERDGHATRPFNYW